MSHKGLRIVRLYNECRNQGVEAGTVDMLIYALAVRRGREVLSSDGGLNRCLAVAKKFHEKPNRTAAMPLHPVEGILGPSRLGWKFLLFGSFEFFHYTSSNSAKSMSKS